MDKKIDTTCEHIKLRLIAAAVGLQQCTKTDGTEVLIPGTGKRILIGNDAWLAKAATPAEASQPETEDLAGRYWKAPYGTASQVDPSMALPSRTAAEWGVPFGVLPPEYKAELAARNAAARATLEQPAVDESEGGHHD